MPEKSFALEPGGTPRLGLSWRGGYKDLSVSCDGQPLASFDDPKELKEPQRVALPDGSTLDVQVASPFLLPELLLTRDGEPVPGSSGDPATRHAAAWQMVAAVAVLNVVVGLLVEVFDAGFLRGIGAGWPSVFAGLVYAVLAWFVRGRSIVALGIAVALFVLDGLFVMASATQAGGTPPVGGLVARVFFLDPDAARLPGPARAGPAAPAASGPARRVGPATRPHAGDAAGSSASAGATGPAAHVLSGDAERQRLRMTERLNTGPAPTVLGRGAVSMKGQASVDAAAARPALSRPQVRDRRGGPARDDARGAGP